MKTTHTIIAVLLFIFSGNIAMAADQVARSHPGCTGGGNEAEEMFNLGRDYIKETPMDTSHWRTYCIGRFLIDLPPSLTLLIEDSVYSGIYGKIWGSPLVWRKDLTPESARQEAAVEIEKWKNTQNEKTKGSMYLGTVELCNGGIAILRWGKFNTKETSAFQAWFITPGSDPRVFTYTLRCDFDRKSQAQEHLEYLASTLRTRDEWEPIPTEPGFCFDGGISVHTGEWRSEHAGIIFMLPEYPGIECSFSVEGLGIKGQSLFFDERDGGLPARSRASKAPYITMLRKNELTLEGGIPAQEFLYIEEKRPSSSLGKGYHFKLRVASDGKRFDRPEVSFFMHNYMHRRDGSTPFRSYEEALGLWDAITRSIRLRPGAI